MGKGKIIQDPVHGYVTVEEEFIDILNSAQFQRLKRITQSSFRVLYPGATHDRFIHSLGTYHLAQKAVDNFFNNIAIDIGNNILKEDVMKQLRYTFLYAALLHDVGHAPFSHTCEGYFSVQKADDNQRKKIDNDLLKAVKEVAIITKDYEEFEKDYSECFDGNNKKRTEPSPHEKMSATMLIMDRESFWKKDAIKIDFVLAARMVIGLEYGASDSDNQEYNDRRNIGNCLIQLLNSSSLDVDKLDYISRDTKMTGFSNVQLDIERITTAFTVDNNNGKYELVFKKNMLSVIDNVFRAKTEQGLWIISHPIVVYESNLIERCIQFIQEMETSERRNYVGRVFSYEALTKDGIEFRNKMYRLLSDDDIICDFKNFLGKDNETVIEEYFNRSSRRKPLWKSYHEFLAFFYEDGKTGDIIEKPKKVYEFFEPLLKYLEGKCTVLNDETIEKIKSDEPAGEKRGKILSVANLLKEICADSGVSFDLVLISVKNSFGNKVSTENIRIKFTWRDESSLIPYSALQERNGEKSIPFFYIYSKQPLERKYFINKLEALMDNE